LILNFGFMPLQYNKIPGM